jgi:hypothetical protein
MSSIVSILTLLLKSIFVGFGVIIPLLYFIKTSNLKFIKVKDVFVATSVWVIRVSGILYAVFFLLNTFLIYLDRANAGEWGPWSVKIMLFGEYSIMYWFPPLMFVLLSQLFWIQRVYVKKPILVVIAILMLILPSYRLVLFFINLGKGYNSIIWTFYPPATPFEIALNIIVYIFIVFTILLLGGKLKDKTA